jgi:Protein of unknown function (DUF998)
VTGDVPNAPFSVTTGSSRSDRGILPQDVDQAHRSDAGHVREPGTRARMLPLPGFAPQLGGDLADLSDTGGADGMAHGEQPARGADCDAAADIAGLARIGIAASPVPASGATPRHLAWTVLGAVTIAVWPAFAALRTSPRPLILGRYGSAAVTAVFVALLGWLLIETRDGSVLGLAERLTSSIQTCWPFIVAVALRRTPRPPSRPGSRPERRGEGRGHRAGQGPRPQAGPVMAARPEAPRAGAPPATVWAPARRPGGRRGRRPSPASSRPQPRQIPPVSWTDEYVRDPAG